MKFPAKAFVDITASIMKIATNNNVFFDFMMGLLLKFSEVNGKAGFNVIMPNLMLVGTSFIPHNGEWNHRLINRIQWGRSEDSQE